MVEAVITDTQPSDTQAPAFDNSEILTKVTEQVEYWDNYTGEANELADKCRDYRDGKQWTIEEAARLRSRKQAPIVVNRIKPKVEGLLGLLQVRKTDPKAYPRTQKHEEAAHAVTDGLRYVVEANDFHESVKMPAADNFFTEGTAAICIDINGKKIDLKHIPWDCFYYDPDSRKHDFSDARFLGYFRWLNKDQVKELFPDADFSTMVANSSRVYKKDSMLWVNKETEKALIAVHYFIQDGVWHFCVFNSGAFLVDPAVSPYLDDEGQPMCGIEAASAFIDREGNRYSEVSTFLDQQDEINHRRSKFLHMLNSRQTMGRKGAVDVSTAKGELKKPDGHVEYVGAKGDFEVIPNTDAANGQVQLYQDAKAELDSVSFNAQLAGERQQGDLSGKAIDRLQQAGTIELNRMFTILSGLDKRVYRQIWARIKQFWDEEMWIRITDDQDNLKWVGLNYPVTVQEFLEEQINDKSLDLYTQKRYAATYQFLMQSAANGIPDAQAKLQQIIEVRNDVAQLDVDIIVEESNSFVNIQQEQFQLLAQLYQPGSGIDIIDLIKVSELRGKEELIDSIKKTREAAAQSAQSAQALQIKGAEAKIAETTSKANMNQAKAIQTGIENQLLITQPHQVNSVSV